MGGSPTEATNQSEEYRYASEEGVQIPFDPHFAASFLVGQANARVNRTHHSVASLALPRLPETGRAGPRHPTRATSSARYPSWPYHRIEHATETSFEVDHMYVNSDGTPRPRRWPPGESHGNVTPWSEIHFRIMPIAYPEDGPDTTPVFEDGSARENNPWDANTW